MRFLLPTVLAAALAGTALAAEPVFPRGSRIGIVPPPTMVPIPGATGFRDTTTGAAIMLIEMPPEAYRDLAASFTEQGLKAQGFRLGKRQVTRIGDAEGVLISGEQNENGRAIPKAVLVAGDADMTAVVVAQSPVGAPAEARAELYEALTTVVFRPPLSIEDKLDALPFRIRDRADFRPVRVMGGNSLFMTDGPADTVRDAAQPILIIAQSFGAGPLHNQRDAFARAALVTGSQLQEIRIERSQSFRQAGADWHEIVAKAKDALSSRPVIVMQTIRFQPSGYVRALGIVRQEARDDVLPRFRAVVDSILVGE